MVIRQYLFRPNPTNTATLCSITFFRDFKHITVPLMTVIIFLIVILDLFFPFIHRIVYVYTTHNYKNIINIAPTVATEFFAIIKVGKQMWLPYVATYVYIKILFLRLVK